MELKGKVAVVTGGASGIGLATVKAFTAKGAKVVIADFDEDGGKATERELKDHGADVFFAKTDVAVENQVKSLVKQTVDHYGKIDIMFNNAGVGVQGQTHELSDEDYQKVISINQNGVFYGSKYAVQEMLKSGSGVIVNTSSILGTVGEPSAFAYNASKGAVNLMTKSLALQYAEKNIRVNAVAPGYIESGLVNKEKLGEFYNGLVAKHPMGRIGNPDEVAHTVVFLCENDFITGTIVHVDGGYTAQ
ncbi:NAD(P)-dependent dehydrogenase, short-chain alcohol dehydrogenase family [Lentibacillus halodurans]|uniref:NAD(P)-dependent dehydrogenase, short-chain alcohol dehydrogenase family n=1 Tax=Lentibacillus halodurans TaxID=237679 RepID=A0A1I0YC37_9BACI|nr:glucose 1-dehydrogenase [Lentibacillus halodurans]SFB10929.1 NAD(P)-dependent dehydrogenase, short-chain alcohol dehydrogenase family [Lentibacillus halodurans]